MTQVYMVLLDGNLTKTAYSDYSEANKAAEFVIKTIGNERTRVRIITIDVI